MKTFVPLVFIVFCVAEFALYRQFQFVRVLEKTALSYQPSIMIGIVIWFLAFLVLRYSSRDFFLILLLLIGVIELFWSKDTVTTKPLVLGFGIAMGKGTQVLLTKYRFSISSIQAPLSIERVWLLFALTGLLATSSLLHINFNDNFYNGLRWMGIWGHPNIYGALMGAGTTLAIGLRMLCQKLKVHSLKSNKAKTIYLSVCVLMMGVGLVMSYSRGAWLATGIGLMYLAWCLGKLQWRYVLLIITLVAFAALYFWGSTPDSAPWYVKRADFESSLCSTSCYGLAGRFGNHAGSSLRCGVE